nr:hypothetical protein Iba_chr14aCG3890 [Ipomoea batatas]
MRGSQGGGLDVTRRARGGAGQEVGKFREVEDRGFSLDRQGGDVVGPSGHLGAGESAEPDPRLLLGLPDLRYPFPPRPHSHPHVVQSWKGGRVFIYRDGWEEKMIGDGSGTDEMEWNEEGRVDSLLPPSATAVNNHADAKELKFLTRNTFIKNYNPH